MSNEYKELICTLGNSHRNVSLEKLMPIDMLIIQLGRLNSGRKIQTLVAEAIAIVIMLFAR